MVGDNFYRSFANLYAIRGTKYRNPMEWVYSLDKIRSLNAKYLIPSHSRPVVGKDNVYNALTDYRDAIQFVHDQTVRYINKGLLPDDHDQSAGAARSLVLKESDVVIMVGARLNWLLSHGKGKSWGKPHSTKFVQIDIEPKEMDSNVEIVAPLVGDIESCLMGLIEAMKTSWVKPSVEWMKEVSEKKAINIARLATKLNNNNSPMDYDAALGSIKTIIKERPDIIS